MNHIGSTKLPSPPGLGPRFLKIAYRSKEVPCDKAELEAAQKAAECERQGQEDQAANWRKIQAAIKEMRGPHAS